MSTSTNWPTIEDRSVIVEGKPMPFPDFTFVNEVGRGANAAVFEAIDQSLNRRVAVKIWNARGIGRAQSETAKIAQLNHPLIVATHQFGRIEGHPYAVMEFVAGCSGKEWLNKGPSIAARILVWRLYSRALRFIHGTGGIHGDPHIGNVLVFSDPKNVYGHSLPHQETGLSIKVADTGTSEFWSSRDDILIRESKLIYETAKRLFSDHQLQDLWVHPAGLAHEDALQVLDVLCDYIGQVNNFLDYDRRSENARTLAALLMKVPLFELDAVVSQVERTGYTTADRLVRRINQKLFKVYDLMDASDELGPETRLAYASARRAFVARITRAASP
jgi:serine/threonine protein kinase